MRILFICDGLGGGGKERRFVQLVKGLNDNGYGELHLLMIRDELAYRELESYDIKTTYLLRSQSGFFRKFCRYIYALKPDLVQTWEFVPMFYFSMISPFLPFKCSYSLSTAADCNFHLWPYYKQVIHRWSCLLADTVVGNSLAGLENYRVPVSKRHCIYNGFDMARLQRDLDKDIRKELNIKTKYVVSMVASFSPWKEWSMYVHSAFKLLKKRNDVTFLAVGEGSSRRDVEKLVPAEYKNQILFLGRRADIEIIFRGTDISVLCTNPEMHSEGVSNSILESCAFGIPVIATRGGGTAEIIQDGKCGFIIEPHDIEELSDRIDYLLNNLELRRNMGKESREMVTSKFSLDRATRQYIELFDNAICDE